MKLIEAMKKVKDLLKKAEDLRNKVRTYCVDRSTETAVYGDKQPAQIKEWIQAHHDVLQEIAKLKTLIQKTNLATMVSIELGGKEVTKSIAEWIFRRRELATLELAMWSGIGDKGIQEGSVKTSTGEIVEVKIRRYYDAKERDTNMELYRSEPMLIDSVLEVKNAITDLLD